MKQATIGTKLFSWWYGTCVGQDVFGNRYYQEKREPKGRRRKRWVIFNGLVEASKVPPLWHGWLHHTLDDVPAQQPQPHAWEQPHLPNLTGTRYAYAPNGHASHQGERASTNADYIPWKP